jgi:hypothetical protein
MKNLCKVLGIIAIIALVGISVIGCKDAVQDVKVVETERDKAPQVASVSVIKTAPNTNSYAQVTWNAVEGALGYDVYYKKEGSVSVLKAGAGQNQYIYPEDGANVNSVNDLNFDVDVWSYRATLVGTIPLRGAEPGAVYEFGVVTTGLLSDSTALPSDIVWSTDKIEM